MKLLILLLILTVTPTAAFSQHFSLTGTVLDQHHEPAEFVYASLLKNDSVLVQRRMTDSLGRFTLNAEKGNYRLVLEQFGMAFTKREIALGQDTDLGELIVDESVSLGEITIAGRKKLVEQKVDRLVFHVENALSATGGTALDALKATPTVRVDNDNVSIVGKGEVLVMIDDRLQRMSQEDLAAFLKTIPADNINSIEVITTPPAQYDAEGNNGLINIRLKTARANSWNASIGGSYTQKTYAGGNVQGLFNYNHNKLSLQASVNKSRQELAMTSGSRIFYTAETWHQETRDQSINDALSLGAGADYKLTKKWTTGLHYLGSFSGREAMNRSLTTRTNAVTDIASSYIAADAQASNTPEMNALNWYNAFALDSSGKTLTADIDFFNYRKKDANAFAGNALDQTSAIMPGTFFSSTNTNINRVRNYSAKIDVFLPYKWAELSFGAKAASTTTHNDLAVYDNQSGTPVLNTDQTNVFTYGEHNEAAYVSAAKKLGAKWESQLGLRLEATQTVGYSENLDQTNRNNYVKLFPTAYVTYVPNAGHSFSLSYSKRIRRPDFDYLNPFVIRTNPYDYYEGNPFLKPSYINNVELSYVDHQKWVSSVYFSHISDFGQELSIIDANTNTTRRTPVNYANTYQLGFSTYYNLSKWSWWNSFTGFNVNYQHIASKTDFIQSIDGYNAYCYSNNDFTLNPSKTLFLGVNYGLQLPGRYQVFHISTMNILSVSMKVLLLDKKLSLAVIAEDLLNGQRPLITYASNGITTNVRSYGDTRGIRLSVSYKLGNNQLKEKQRDAGNEEDQQRVK